MKKPSLFVILLLAILGFTQFSCTKQADYLQDMLSLRSDINALKRTSDSLANALSQTNTALMQNAANMTAFQRSIDSIKLQITSVSTQIQNLTNQLNTDNADIVSIKNQLAILNQKYADLLTLLNNCCAMAGLTNGLVAYYPFTGNANDSSGNANHGTAYNVTLVPDRNGTANSAYQFSGSQNSYIDCGNTSSLRSIRDTMSISLWFKASGGTINPRIINFGNGLNGFAEYSINIEPVSGNNYRLIAGYRDITTTTNITLGNWYHVVFNVSNNRGDLYLNGSLIHSITGTMNGLSFPTSTGNLNIGRMNHVNFDAFDGIIDDIRIYKRNLSNSEIDYLYRH
jgi:hypothetical protein